MARYLQVSPSPARRSCFSIVLRSEVDAYDATKRVALERHSTDSVDKNFALDERNDGVAYLHGVLIFGAATVIK